MKQSDKHYFDNVGDENFKIFKRFPELIPAVGSNFWRDYDDKLFHKKLIFVGESNYFKDVNEDESVFRDPKQWYYGDCSDKLIPARKKEAVSNWKGCGDGDTFGKVFAEATAVLDNNIPRESILNEFVFYDYFLRPAEAKNGRYGFIPEQIDEEIAYKAFDGIIDLLLPDLIIFLSKESYKSFNKYDNSKHSNYTIVPFDHPRARKKPENYYRQIHETLEEKWIK